MGSDVNKNNNMINLSKDIEKIKEKKSLLTMDIKDVRNYLKEKSKGFIPHKEKKRKVIAFDIGTKIIKIVQGTYYNEKLSIDECIKLKTPHGSIDEGQILNRSALCSVIGEAMIKHNIKADYGICTTNPSSIINREISIPKVNNDEIETVVRYEIKQYLPINLDECILQMITLGEKTDQFDGKERMDLRVTVYPKETAIEYYKLLEELKLKPYALDVNFNAVNKIVNFSELNKFENKRSDSVVLMDMGENFIDVNIYKGQKLDFTRTIKIGGRDINEALIYKGMFTEEVAESVKINDVDLNDELDVKVENSIVVEIVDEWIEKMEMILQFYKNQEVGNNIGKIIIYGGSSKLKGLEKYMSDKLGIEVTALKNLNNVTIKNKNGNELDLSDYINAIGSVIRL